MTASMEGRERVTGFSMKTCLLAARASMAMGA
jgi:hypothetical protein